MTWVKLLVEKAGMAAAILKLALLAPVQLFVEPPMLLAERFVPGAGWVEIGLAALYSFWLSRRLAIDFGLIGLLVMLISSRRTGAMVHCSTWCPIGWITTTLGRVSPLG